LGLDFGTSNTYLVELNFAEEARQIDYFTFRVKPRVKDSLTDLQARITQAKAQGLLLKKNLEANAYERRVDFVCHSVKLEGAELTRGETVEVLERSKMPSSVDNERQNNLERLINGCWKIMKSSSDSPKCFHGRSTKEFYKG